MLFKKVTIIGVGLIGGSLGKAIRKRKLAEEVTGMSQRQTSLDTALKEGAIDHAAHDLKKAVMNADLVVLATPVSIISATLARIGPFLKRGCIVTDVGSTKEEIVYTAEQNLPPSAFFVGSHPLAGSEKTGVDHSESELFQDTVCLMTPTDATNRVAREKVKRLWNDVGCHVKFLAPEEHDLTLAYVSHLPHLVAYALMGSIPDEYLPYAAKGLRDVTRIASSSPQMWNDIFLANPKGVLKGIDDLVRKLAIFRKAVVTEDSKTLMEHFKIAKSKRDSLH